MEQVKNHLTGLRVEVAGRLVGQDQFGLVSSCLLAVFLSAAVLRVSPRRLAHWTWATARQLALPLLTIASTVAIAFLMNYSGATATLGLAFAASGVMFPFFSAFLGWLGVF